METDETAGADNVAGPRSLASGSREVGPDRNSIASDRADERHWPLVSIAKNHWLEPVLVLLGFTLVSGALYQTPLVGHASTMGAGLGLPDNNAYVWMLAWPAHAIAHGLGLFHPNIVFVPEGYNLARATPMFIFGVPLIPLTLLAGPIVTYNVVMLAVPALNGVCAYALCRRLGASWGPAALGGFVFATSGVVTFSELGAPSTGCGAFIALAVLFILELVNCREQRRRRRAAVFLGLDLVAQIYSSSEMLATFLVFAALALMVTWALDRPRRPKIRTGLPLFAVAGAILVLGSLPYVLAFAFDGGGSLSHSNPNMYPNDLLGFVVPTQLFRFGRSYFAAVSGTFIGEASEAYIGLGLIVITVWHVAERWRTEPAARVLGVLLAAVAICSLGTHLTIAGHGTIPMPWDVVQHMPLMRYALPSRMSLFIALGVAVALALWMSRRRRWIGWPVALASCALLVPNSAVKWATSFHTPRFFTSGAAAREFTSRDRVIVVPYAGPDDEAQAESGFAFSLAGGYLGQYPMSYGQYMAPTYFIHREAPAGAPLAVAQFVRAKGVDSVVVEDAAPGPWRQLFSGLGVQPVAREGVLIYRLAR